MVSPTAPLSEIRLLIIENDQKIAWLERDILTSFGFRDIHFVEDGRQAISKMLEMPFDLVISDWETRGMTGIDFVKFVRHDKDSPNPFIPIIMITGRAEREDVEEARDAGATEFVAKPFRVQDIRDRIIEVIERPRKFVLGESFSGPDRRRKAGNPPDGVERRKTVRSKKIA